MVGSSLVRGAAAAIGLALAAAAAWAQPAGASAVVGSVTTQQEGNSLVVTTTNGAGANYSVIDWRSFSVPAGSLTLFQQPGADSLSINRVTGSHPSEILGTLASNGRLVLVNPAGIAVGSGAVIDTAGFTASSLALPDADARAGRLRFEATKHARGVEVAGRVIARNGDVVLIGRDVSVARTSLVQAAGGGVLLAAGRSVELTGRGLEGIVLTVSAPGHRAVNLGRLEGDAVDIFASHLRHSGAIQARAVKLVEGGVVLDLGGGPGRSGEHGHGNGNGSGNRPPTDTTSDGGVVIVPRQPQQPQLPPPLPIPGTGTDGGGQATSDLLDALRNSAGSATDLVLFQAPAVTPAQELKLGRAQDRHGAGRPSQAKATGDGEAVCTR